MTHTAPFNLGEGEVVKATEKALLIQLESGDEVWIPKSVLHEDSEVTDAEENSAGNVVVALWWARSEGLA